MIGHRARKSWAARDRINTVWRRLAMKSAASTRKIPGAANARVTCAEEVSIKANNYFGFVERVADIERLSKRSARAIVDVVPINRIVLMPSGARVSRQHLLDLRCECRRGHSVSQDT